MSYPQNSSQQEPEPIATVDNSSHHSYKLGSWAGLKSLLQDAAMDHLMKRNREGLDEHDPCEGDRLSDKAITLYLLGQKIPDTEDLLPPLGQGTSESTETLEKKRWEKAVNEYIAARQDLRDRGGEISLYPDISYRDTGKSLVITVNQRLQEHRFNHKRSFKYNEKISEKFYILPFFDFDAEDVTRLNTIAGRTRDLEEDLAEYSFQAGDKADSETISISQDRILEGQEKMDSLINMMVENYQIEEERRLDEKGIALHRKALETGYELDT